MKKSKFNFIDGILDIAATITYLTISIIAFYKIFNSNDVNIVLQYLENIFGIYAYGLLAHYYILFISIGCIILRLIALFISIKNKRNIFFNIMAIIGHLIFFFFGIGFSLIAAAIILISSIYTIKENKL